MHPPCPEHVPEIPLPNPDTIRQLVVARLRRVSNWHPARHHSRERRKIVLPSRNRRARGPIRARMNHAFAVFVALALVAWLWLVFADGASATPAR